MQPGDNIAARQTSQNGVGSQMETATNVTMTSAPDNIMAQNPNNKKKDKMSKKQIVGLVVLSLIAVGGVLFGVYGMNSQNSQIEELKVRATNAEGKVAELETEKITVTEPSGVTTEITDSAKVSNSRTPVIISKDSGEEYSFNFEATVNGHSDANNIMITVKEGEVTYCSIGKKQYTQTNGGDSPGYSISEVSSCTINGLSGKIYKVIDFWSGQMKMDDNIGFILEDGTVEYFKFSDAIANSNINVKKLNINGSVVDAFDVGINPTTSPVGGYVSTIFVLADGSYVKYDESMLN